jgi:hypothetical protein
MGAARRIAQYEEPAREMPKQVMVIMNLEDLRPMLFKMIEEMREYDRQLEGKEKRPAYHDQVNTKIAKKIMADKGWMAKSSAAFRQLMDEFGVQPTKRGREHWFVTKQLEAIPNKK